MEQETKTTPVAETWRPVKGFEGLYEVSDLARVRSVDRYVTITDKDGRTRNMHFPSKMRKLQMGHNGYLILSLRKDGKSYLSTVHRYVAEAFIPNPDNLPEVNHKDECKTNNLPSNLEWCDRSYNSNYGTLPERISKAMSKPIEQLTLDGKHVAYYKSAAEYERISGRRKSRDNIGVALRGKGKTAYGYLWRFV